MIKVASGPRSAKKPRSVLVPELNSGGVPAFRPRVRAAQDEEREWEVARQRALQHEAREWEHALREAKARAAADEEREWQQSLARAKAQLQHEEREWRQRISRARSSRPRHFLGTAQPTFGSAPRFVPIAWP